MNDACMRYFRDSAIVRATTLGVTGSYQQILQYDPMRYMTTAWNDGTIDLTLVLYDNSNPTNATLHIPSGMGPVVLHEDVFGELVRLPIFAKSATAGPTNVTFYSCSYDPYKYQEMIEYVHQYISKFRAL